MKKLLIVLFVPISLMGMGTQVMRHSLRAAVSLKTPAVQRNLGVLTTVMDHPVLTGMCTSIGALELLMWRGTSRFRPSNVMSYCASKIRPVSHNDVQREMDELKGHVDQKFKVLSDQQGDLYGKHNGRLDESHQVLMGLIQSMQRHVSDTSEFAKSTHTLAQNSKDEIQATEQMTKEALELIQSLPDEYVQKLKADSEFSELLTRVYSDAMQKLVDEHEKK